VVGLAEGADKDEDGDNDRVDEEGVHVGDLQGVIRDLFKKNLD
jgi:hypothetical protein